MRTESDLIKEIQEFRGIQKLAAAVIADSLKTINRGVIDICNHCRADLDIRWIHDPESNFEFWCTVAGMDPDKFRRRLPIRIKNKFKTVSRDEYYRKKLGNAYRRKKL